MKRTKFVPTDRVVEHEYVNGDRGEPLYQQLKENGDPTDNFWTLKEIAGIGGQVVSAGAPGTGAPVFDMVLVEGGTFEMGSNDGDDDERPVHTVEVGSFYMGRYAVTQAQWRQVMGRDPGYFKNCDECPVESVSWEDIQEFLQKLNQMTGQDYRLPTEAEWEFAARGGNKSKGYKYAGSNDLEEVAWYWHNSGEETHPVGQKKPNELGLYDMTGNVWEWCSDRYGPGYYAGSPRKDPQGPATGNGRVYRGGSWCSYPGNSLATLRNTDLSTFRNDNIGFRLVRPAQ